MTVLIERKTDTARAITRILSEKQGDVRITVITDSNYALNNGYQNLIEEVDMVENNIIIVNP